MSRKPVIREIDALDLLKRDHDTIQRLFKDYERLARRPGDLDRKAEVVGRICYGLSIHAQIEEEVFYPVVRAAVSRNELTRHTAFGHAQMRELIARLDEMEPGDADYDSTVVELAKCVGRHIAVEQEDVFPKLCLARVDRVALGRELVQRQKALHEDVTRVWLPRSSADVPTWPAACRVVMA